VNDQMDGEIIKSALETLNILCSSEPLKEKQVTKKPIFKKDK
jgi:hypothetical protein